MSIIKTLSRKIFFPVIYSLGLEKLISSATKNDKIVLMFHGVTKDDTTWFSSRHLPLNHFTKLIEYISKNFEVCSLESFSRNEFSTSKRKKVLVTFDDGYLNNLKYALPVMEKYKVPAVYFISTLAYREDQLGVLWADLITVVSKQNGGCLKFGGLEFINDVNQMTGENLFHYIKRLPAHQRDQQLIEFCIQYKVHSLLEKVDGDIWKLMSQEELKQFNSSDFVTIGSHADLHYNLGNISLEDAKSDMLKSKNILESLIGVDVNSIAYPDGSYSSEVKDAAEKIGFSHQFAVGYLLPEDALDSRILCRHGISSTTTFESNVIHIHRAFKNKGWN
ncbi:MAG: polysaccharide deacetylase family protein [Flavobacteriales bacterium]|jgi:peptidoglycan/xylan/chitin deacetylase (PgdA/CDA1 family)